MGSRWPGRTRWRRAESYTRWVTFVPVPVPEEHVEEFNRFVLGLTLTGQSRIDPDVLAAAASSLSERQRRFVEVVRTGAAIGDRLTYPVVAQAAGIPLEDVLQVIMEVNHVFTSAGAPACVLTEPKVTLLPDGTTQIEPVVMMLGTVADALARSHA